MSRRVPAAASFGQGVDDEQVAVKRKATEECAGRVDHASQVGQQRGHVGIGGSAMVTSKRVPPWRKAYMLWRPISTGPSTSASVASGRESDGACRDRGQGRAHAPGRWRFEVEQTGARFLARHEKEQAGAGSGRHDPGRETTCAHSVQRAKTR